MTTTIGARPGRPPERDATARCSVGRCRPGKRRFWSRDDDLRDGAFATPAPRGADQVLRGAQAAGLRNGPRALGADHVRTRAPCQQAPEIFSSVPASTTLAEIDPAVAEFGGSIINLDDPRHQRLRSIVNRAFTPKMVARIGTARPDQEPQRLVADMIAEPSRQDRRLRRGRLRPLPLQIIICDMMGIPRRTRPGLPLDDGPAGRRRQEVAHNRDEIIRSSSISPPTASSARWIPAGASADDLTSQPGAGGGRR